jgi:excinuclease ABC subunit A
MASSTAPPASTPAAIRVRGAREHNLRSVDVDVPLRRLTVVTGVSGSGKSSLAFDTLYAEGQRRYVETFSAYARQFLERMDAPRADAVEGIPPAVAIDRTAQVRNSRSTVGTMTEILDHLKLLYAKVGRLSCAGCGRPVERDTPSSAADALRALPRGRRFVLWFPLPLGSSRTPKDAAQDLATAGFTRVLVGDETRDLRADGTGLEGTGEGGFLRVVVDRLVAGAVERARLVDSLETAFRAGGGRAGARCLPVEGSAGEDLRFTRDLRCEPCGRDFRAPFPNLFSFNSPLGACGSCHGFGRTIGIDRDLVVPDPARSIREGAVKPLEAPAASDSRAELLALCRRRRVRTDVPWASLTEEERRVVFEGDGRWDGVDGFFEWLRSKSYKVHVRVFLARFRGYPACVDCGGTRLAPEGRAWRVGGKTLPEVSALSVGDARAFFAGLDLAGADGRAPSEAAAAALLLQEIRTRLDVLDASGLSYLTLDRPARTLSGGEVQRTHLASAIGSSLVNALYVLDEPSIGLHPRDNARLVRILRRLRDQGNTVVVVEHDPAILEAADHLIDLGPGAGEAGGRVVAQGTPARVAASPESRTGAFLARRRRVEVPPRRDVSRLPRVGVRGARANNLRRVDLEVPLGAVTVLTGVSGSGKSTLAHDVLYLAVRRALGRPEGTPGPHDEVVGVERLSDAVLVDQSALQRTPRANAATYLGAWDRVRALFARTPLAVARGYGPATFSFNVPGGRCERCRGDGHERVEMQFLSDVHVPCPECGGRRFRPEVCEVVCEGLTLPEVLELTVDEARARFAKDRRIARALAPLADVGLGYLRLGQPLSTLSGGEAQRVKLAEALAAPAGTKPVLYVLDEPTTGLHLEDVSTLVRALARLADRGHAVLAIEHHLDVIRAADLVVDLGPEGGPGGGEVVARGTPEEVASSAGHTGRHLRAAIAGLPDPDLALADRAASPAPAPLDAAPGAIEVHGAREHNLKDLSVRVPRDRLVVVTGPSGSGKSTLAFDVVFAEGQRRYVESLSAYARQFVGQLSRPDVDRVTGIPPTVAIGQRTTRGSSRSTVATQTEVAHYLRLLFAKAGTPHCPVCSRALEARSEAAIVDRLVAEHAGREVALLAPVVVGRKGHHRKVLLDAAKRGRREVRVDGAVLPVSPVPKLARFREHDVEEVVGRFRVGPDARPALRSALAEAVALGNGGATLLLEDGSTQAVSTLRTCPRDGTSVPDLDPKSFSHNSPRGWCPSCRGLGTQPRVDPDLLPVVEDRTLRGGAIPALSWSDDLKAAFLRDARRLLGVDRRTRLADLDAGTRRRLLAGGRGPRGTFRGAAAYVEDFLRECPDVAIDWCGAYAGRTACGECGGARLNPASRAVRVGGRTLPDLLALPVERFLAEVSALPLAGRDAAVAEPIRKELASRSRFLERVGLGYLTLDRSAVTLSGGESQRIRLAAALGSNLRGACYVLDEPTIGLHVRDNERLLRALEDLRDRGNTMVVVEHDEDTIRRADHVIDLGPAGGRGGGRVVAEGPPAALAADPASPTGRLLARPPTRLSRGRDGTGGALVVEGATARNLKDVTVSFPVGRLTAVTGVSGSGKSTLVRDVLYEGVRRRLGAKGAAPAAHREIRGARAIERTLEVDQTPVGKTPRSVPATYLGVWDDLRTAFASTPEARSRGYGPGRFSFNVGGGRCEACKGQGEIVVEMSFLPDVHATCEACRGRRFTAETDSIRWKGRSPSETLAMTFAEAAEEFAAFPRVAPFLRLMHDVGLGHLTLGQPATTLSGGEAQRLKLVTELGKGGREGRTLYVLDEPTTGLHGEDVDLLVGVLGRLVDRGDTVVVIEHNLPLIAACDHVVDLGPEGGDGGGRVVAAGSPHDVARAWRESHTGAALRRYARVPSSGARRRPAAERVAGAAPR